MPGKRKIAKTAGGTFSLLEMGICKASELQRDSHNPRSNLPIDRPFLENIARYGVLEPLYITEDLRIIDGNRRHKALEELGELDQTVKIIMVTGDERAARFARHGGGSRFWKVYDLAVECQAALDDGMSVEDIALACCRYTHRVQRLLGALQNAKKYNAAPHQFSYYYHGYTYGVDPEVVANCLTSKHLVRVGDMRKLKVVLTKFKCPWASRYSLEQMYMSALERPLNHGL